MHRNRCSQFWGVGGGGSNLAVAYFEGSYPADATNSDFPPPSQTLPAAKNDLRIIAMDIAEKTVIQLPEEILGDPFLWNYQENETFPLQPPRKKVPEFAVIGWRMSFENTSKLLKFSSYEVWGFCKLTIPYY